MEEIRKKIWCDLLDADMNCRYFGHLASHYYNIDLYSKIFLAVMASGTVAGWVIWNDPKAFPYGVLLWKIFSSASAIISIIIPILNITKKLEAANRLKNDWCDIMREYEILWLQIDEMKPNDAINESRRISTIKSQLSPVERILPLHKHKLILRCNKEVRISRGLDL